MEPQNQPHEVSRILNAACEGDRQAAEDLIPLVYGELRKLAAWRLGQEGHAHTLQATALVHEAYLKLSPGKPQWQGRKHFFQTLFRIASQETTPYARSTHSGNHPGVRRTRKFDHGGAKLSWCGGVRERDRRSWIGDQGWSGGGLDFGKLEWKAQHATERSGVKCGAWNGGFPKSPRRGDAQVHAASGVVTPGASGGPVRAF
jgi:hypothetical protein